MFTNGIYTPTGDGPILDHVRELGRSVNDVIFVPGQVLTDPSIVDTSATDWSIYTGSGQLGVEMRQWFGPLYYLRVQFEYNGAGITVPADGNIANVTLGTMIEEYRPGYPAPLATAYTGPIAAGGVSNVGVITLAAVASGTVITSGTVVELAGLMLCPRMPW